MGDPFSQERILAEVLTVPHRRTDTCAHLRSLALAVADGCGKQPVERIITTRFRKRGHQRAGVGSLAKTLP
jgi:hypothetical protein